MQNKTFKGLNGYKASRYLWIFLLLSFFVFLFSASLINAAEDRQISTEAKQRLQAWKSLIKDQKANAPNPIDKLKAVNQFFNKLPYQPDTPLQGQGDAWQTPYEFLVAGTGDCEDYAIAKYFTLKAVGVSDSFLRITYVTVQPQNEAHMVLAYYATADADPLILDSLKKEILPASQRPDLTPVYSFNADEVWLVERMGKSKHHSKATSLSKWQDTLQRLKQEGEPQ